MQCSVFSMQTASLSTILWFCPAPAPWWVVIHAPVSSFFALKSSVSTIALHICSCTHARTRQYEVSAMWQLYHVTGSSD